MKKLKEFLLLFVPLIICTVLPVVMFVSKQNVNAFVSNAHYLRMFLNDSTFKIALFNTYCYPFIFSLLSVVFVALLCYFIKYIKSRKIFYPASVILSSVVAFFCTYIDEINYFGLPMYVYYDPQYLVSKSPFYIPITYNILLGLQIGLLTTFLFWLVETLISFIDNRKSA